LNRAFEAGNLPGIERDVGHGPETPVQWRSRAALPVHGARHRRAPGRRPVRSRGSRRGSRSSRAGPSGEPPDLAPLARGGRS
jgi:hypothetical protein